MTQTADAVVIGAGINGAATAYNLVRRGLKSVVLVERRLIASGGTGRSAAIIRQHYSNAELVRIVRRSVEIFHNFDDIVGGDPGFVRTGWVFLAPESVSEGLTKNLRLGQRLGVDVREISKNDLVQIEPRMNLCGVHRIAYEPGSGYCDPRQATYAYVKRFLELGGQLQPLTAVKSLITHGGSVTGVRTDRGDIASGVVVNAAGPWADRIAETAGVTIPLQVTREEELIVETEMAGGPPPLCVSDMALAFYYRPDGATRMLVGRGFPKEYETVDPDAYDQDVNVSFIEDIDRRIQTRWPTFQTAIHVSSHVGLYDVTPDWHPVLGCVDGLKGLFLCAGFSGHGFKLGPGIGELLAEEIIDGRASSVDLSRFQLARFSRNELFAAAYGANRA